MIVECGHCGAPLDIDEGSRVIRCRYCGSKNERRSARTVAAETPADFVPPAKWRPPAEFPADSSTELAYSKGSNIGCFLVAGTLLVPCVFALVAWLHDRTGIAGTEPAKLATLETLDGTASDFARALSASSSDATHASTRLHSDRYQYLSFTWDDKQRDHPESFSITLRDGQSADAAARAKLASMLRGGLDAQGSWRWDKVSIGVSPNGVVTAYSDATDHPQWKRQLDDAWRIVLSAVFGVGTPPGKREMLEAMGAGYPTADLAKIEMTTTVDEAAEKMRALFPGAIVTMQGEVEVVVAVDHPLFASAKLRWMNTRGATYDRIDFSPLGGADAFEPKRRGLVLCMSKWLGGASATDEDFVHHIQSYAWSLEGARVDVTRYALSISLSHTRTAAPSDDTGAAVSKAIAAIDGCR